MYVNVDPFFFENHMNQGTLLNGIYLRIEILTLAPLNEQGKDILTERMPVDNEGPRGVMVTRLASVQKIVGSSPAGGCCDLFFPCLLAYWP